MTHKKFLVNAVSLSLCLLLLVRDGCGSAGPVFINPASQIQPTQAAAPVQGSLVTQTVYGFLDFTTTIGNTVMVFSPQSAAPASPAPVSEETKQQQPQVSSVIETKPSESVVMPQPPPIVIKPNKTEKKPTGTSKKLSSIVHVVESIPPTPKTTNIEIKPQIFSQVNVVEGVSSVVNVAPFVSSKVDIIENIKPLQQSVITKVEIITDETKPKPETKSPIISSQVDVYEASPSSASPILLSSIVEIREDAEDEPAVILGNNIGEPEYDFLSRQPSEVVEETYKVINLKPSAKTHHGKGRASTIKNKGGNQSATKRADSLHPTGLVTKLGGTVVKDGVTTVHETSVIGTYISGKYAQVLQSTSHIYNAKQKINPSPTLRILKTAAPALGKKHRHLEPTPAASINEESLLVAEVTHNAIKPTRKPAGSSGFKRFKNRAQEYEEYDGENNSQEKKTLRNRQQTGREAQARSVKQHNTAHHFPNNNNSNKKYGRRKSQISTVSVSSEQATSSASFGTGKRYNSRRNKQHHNQRSSSSSSSTAAPDNGSGFTRRGYKPKVQASTVDNSPSSSLYKFKLNRSPGRWQYKTTPKPRVTIRKVNDDDANETTPPSLPDVSPALNDLVTPQARSDDVDGLVGSESVASIVDDESSTENKLDTPFLLETIKVEISTPPDFKDIYYEIATIKSPYTFQVGSVKNTRYITVTSTFEKSLEASSEPTQGATPTEPLTENILATTSNYDKDNNFLDSSIATLPPIYLASDMETPPLETLTDTFSTTQTMLKTHILPVIRGGNDTTSYTLVQTYLVTRLVTATKTLPPMEAYHFNPSKTLNEFNSHLDEAGSELHLELEFGDQNEQDDGTPKRAILPGDLDLANIGSDFDLSSVDKSRIPDGLKLKKSQLPSTTPKPVFPDPIQTPGLSPEQLQQLALFRLLNPGAAPPQGQVVTASKPVLKVETVYESHVIPVINGQNTIFSTLSKAVGTVTRTDYEYITSTIPSLPIPPVPVNPLFPQQQPQYAVTSSPVVQTTILTQTQSKILKLTFGAKTAYTTIFSTKVVPTVLTTYMTGSVAVAPTAAFPGFFPAPYPPFPYVG